MHSRSGGLPSAKSPDDYHRPDDENKREGPSRANPVGSSSPQKNANTSPRVRRGLRNKQPSHEVPASERSNPHQHRIGRNSSIEDSYWSRNWNSEGGRPKRERTFSDRPQSKRLLHRAAVNSVGKLIPFQRAPRDGSYESYLPQGRKTAPKKHIRQDERKELEQRQPAGIQESPDSTPVEVTARNVPSVSTGVQRRQSIDMSKITNNNKSDGNTSRITKKQSTQEAQTRTRKGSVEVAPRGPPPIGQMRKGLISSQEKSQITNTIKKLESDSSRVLTDVGSNTSSNVPANTSSGQHNGHSLSSQRITEGTTDPSVNQSVDSSQAPSSEHQPSEKEQSINRTASVKSPSAEFKEAAEQGHGQHDHTNNTQISTLRTAGTISVSPNSVLNVDNISAPVSSIPPDLGALEELNARQPNSVVRRGRDSTRNTDTNQGILSQTLTPSAELSSLRPHSGRDQNLSATPTQGTTLSNPEASNLSSASRLSVQSSSSGDVVSVSPRTNSAHPPTVRTSPSASLGPNITSSQQARFNRFGRRIRISSGEESEQPARGETSHVPAEPTPEPVSERYEGTNRQSYRFFTLSGNRTDEDTHRPSVPLTANRDLLYSSTSPPLLRRHMRTQFDPGASNQRETSGGNRGSASVQSSLGSSISDDDLLRGDSFCTSSGSNAIFSPVLQSGPVLDSSSSVPYHRRRLREAGSLIATNTSFSSNDSTSPTELPHLNSSSRSQQQQQRAGGDTDIERSADYDRDDLTFSVDEGRLRRDARRRYQTDRSDAIPRLLSQRSRQERRELPRSSQIMDEVFGSPRDYTHQRRSDQASLYDTSMELQVPLFGSPLFAPLGVPPGMLLSLLVRTRREFGQEFMELLLENMMLNVLAHHLFETELHDGNDDAINGAPPPATQHIIDNLNEIPALEAHIAKEMKCAICHSEYELYETLAELPCKHFFHPTCVAVWLKKSGTCPVCRFDLSSPRK